MTRTLVLTCLLSIPLHAQMQMPMPGQAEPARPKAKQPVAAKPSLNGRDSVAEHPAMPFGRLADGDLSTSPRALPAAPSPVVLGATAQEQEHPHQRTGSEITEMPDLLADVKVRPPQTLQFFLERAAADNPTLREAESQVRRLRAQAKQAGLWDNPEVGYEADHVRGGSYAGGEQGGYVQQTIPLAGQRGAARIAMQAQANAAETILAAQRQRVNSAVAQAFYAALVVQREAELRTDMAALAQDNAVAAHQMANIGQADASDVLGSEVEAEQAKLELATAQREYRKAFAALAAVAGDSSLVVVPLSGDLTALPVLAAGQARQAAEQSPAVQAAQQRAAASDAQIRSARKQAGPQLTLKAGLQQDNEPLDPALRRVGVVGLAQAGLTLPLWNRNQGAVSAARAQQVSAQAEVVRTRLVLHQQAEQAMQDYANAMSQAQSYRDALLPRARRAVELYDGKYAAMAAAYPQRVAARRMLLQMELAYTRVLGAAWQNALVLQHGLLQGGLTPPESIQAEGAPAGN